MYKYRIRLDTISDIRGIVTIAELLPYEVRIENTNGTKRGCAKTLFNVLDAISYDKVYIVSDYDMYTKFVDYIIDET